MAGLNTTTNGPNNTFLTEVDEEIKHMSADEFIHQQEIQQLQLQEQKVQMKRNSKESQTLAYNHMLERIAKMKSIWNKLDIIHRDKSRTLSHFEHQVSIKTVCVDMMIGVSFTSPPFLCLSYRPTCGTSQMHSC